VFIGQIREARKFYGDVEADLLRDFEPYFGTTPISTLSACEYPIHP
jgi:hypothetical protein